MLYLGMGDMKIVNRALEEANYDVDRAVEIVYSVKKEGGSTYDRRLLHSGNRNNNIKNTDKTNLNQKLVALSI